MSQLDVHNAKRALGARLVAWGLIDDPGGKAAGFIDDLVASGWQMAPNRETRPRPPRRVEECPKHPGSHSANCGGCRSDALAEGEQEPVAPLAPAAAIAAARAALRGECA